MVRISKKKMARAAERAMQEQLLFAIMHARTKRDALAFVKELLSSTERIMLAKRFAVVAMLVNGYHSIDIETLLKVSPDTVGRVWRDVRSGRYERVVRYARNNPRKFEGESLESVLEKVFNIVPPRVGRGRWQYIDQMFKKGTYD